MSGDTPLDCLSQEFEELAVVLSTQEKRHSQQYCELSQANERALQESESAFQQLLRQEREKVEGLMEEAERVSGENERAREEILGREREALQREEVRWIVSTFALQSMEEWSPL